MRARAAIRRPPDTPVAPRRPIRIRERRKNRVDVQPYEAPQVNDLGDVTEVTLGSAADDTADMNTARYY
jgi:hypothetical protein